MTFYSTPQPSLIYASALYAIARGQLDWMRDDIKVMLCTRDYGINIYTHRCLSDITHEVEGEGYTPGGLPITAKTVSFTEEGRVMVWDAADVQWRFVTLSAQRAVFYQDTGDPDTSQLIGCIFFDDAPPVVFGSFTITWGIDGAAQLPNPDWPPRRKVTEIKTWPFFRQITRWKDQGIA